MLEIITKEDVAAETAREARRLGSLVETTEHWYRRNRANEDVRNLSYYRGNFWRGDGFGTRLIDGESSSYAAQQNEIFPIVDTVVSSLAMDVPAVEPVDQRYTSHDVPTRETDFTIRGRRIGAVLNFWAEEDELDRAVQEWVLHAELFGQGVLKTSWSPILGRPIFRTRLPWEWHCDPSAKRMSEANWCFERFVLHIDDLRERVEKKTYDLINKEIRADTYPRSLVDEEMTDQDEQRLREDGLREYVGMVEFWDFRRQKLIHYHPGTRQILYFGDMPYGRPYDLLVFHDAIGRIRGLSDVSLLASNQRDINAMVSARREMVFRLQQRVLLDRSLFRDESEFERMKNAKPWEWQLCDFPNDGPIQNKVFVSPGVNASFDFDKHLGQTTDSIRWTTGLADYQRGEVVNIRTAAEATMVRASVEGRMHIRVTKVKRAVSSVFRRALEVWRWAIENEDESGINMEEIAFLTQADTDAETLTDDVLSASPRFRLLPFSPLMEDKYTRRQQLTELMQMIGASPLMQAFNLFELARETQELYGLRPSVVQEPQPMPPPVPGTGIEEAPFVQGEIPSPEGVALTPSGNFDGQM
jgi:hypothetical protein